MNKDFMLIPTFMFNQQAIAEILKRNESTVRFGLTLSRTEVQELVETRSESLSSNGRVEFGGGIIDKLIMEFCDSPFISKDNYAQTLQELIETFYYLKNESLDKISDDELISLMRKYFDSSCQGSIELLQNRELAALARNLRFDIQDYKNIFEDISQNADEEDEYESYF